MMKKIDWKQLILTSVISFLPLFVGLALYDKLPDRIAIHFDFHGNPDNYFSKPLFVFGMPAFMMVMQIVCCLISDLSDRYKDANRKAMRAFKWLIPTLSCVMYGITVCFALGYNVDIRRWVMLILGLMFIILGNYTPKLKCATRYPKRFAKSEEAQLRLARYMGFAMVIGGFLCLLSIAFSFAASIIAVALMLLMFCILPFCIRV